MDKNTVFQGFARALLAIVLVAGVASVSACKDSGEGNAQAKAPEAEKAADAIPVEVARASRSEEHTSELQSLMRISYAVFCLKKKKTPHTPHNTPSTPQSHIST